MISEENQHWLLLRRQLGGEPSAALWQDILRTLRRSPTEATWQIDVAYVEEHIAQWPETLRKANVEDLWEHFPHGTPSDLWTLVRSTSLRDDQLADFDAKYLQKIRRLSFLASSYARAAQLLTKERLPQLAHLTLQVGHAYRHMLQPTAAEGGRACIDAIAALPSLKGLLFRNAREDLTQFLARQTPFPLQHLEMLGFSYAPMSGEPLEALLASPTPHLRHLALDGCQLTADDIELLLASPLAAQLQHLSLNDNDLDKVSIRRLTEASTLPSLLTISLEGNELEGMQAELAQASHHAVRKWFYTKHIHRRLDDE